MKFLLFFIFILLFISCGDKNSSENNSCKSDSDCSANQICFGKKCIDEKFLCQNKKCSNHGECRVSNKEAQCFCDEGYVARGMSCVKAPCLKSGDCENNEICLNGECKDENILCEGVDCINGECKVKDKNAFCDCNEGYVNYELKCVEDKCKDKECSAVEICNVLTGECETYLNPCEGIECGEHGECNYDRDGNAFCECEEGYAEINGTCVFDVSCVKTSDIDNCDDGFDNNCDGYINESCSCDASSQKECYDGDISRIGKGVCKTGIMSCIGGEYWGECEGEVLPSEEVCDGLDNDCNGETDKTPSGETLFKVCYSGDIQETEYPDSRCKTGRFECKNGRYDESECIGQVLPLDEEICGNSIDDDCDGQVDEDCVAPAVSCSDDIARAYIFEDPIYLHAEATDSNGEIVSTSWSFFVKPEGSASELNPSNGNRTSFVPDTVGEYIARFTATDNDGEVSYCDIHVNAKTRDHLNVTLIWDKGGRSDMDLHLLKPGASSSDWNTIADCFWAIPNPDWGETGVDSDNPSLDRDDTDGYGPEVIQIERPQNGRYTVGVDYFDAQNEGSSVATVKIICNGEEHVYTSNPMNAKDKWSVVDIVWQDDTCTLEDASRSF